MVTMVTTVRWRPWSPWCYGHHGTMGTMVTMLLPWGPLCHGEHGIVVASGWRLGCRIEQVVGGGEREGAAAPWHKREVWGGREAPQG